MFIYCLREAIRTKGRWEAENEVMVVGGEPDARIVESMMHPQTERDCSFCG